eukprot:767838-Hanusia_phi.AAC.8
MQGEEGGRGGGREEETREGMLTGTRRREALRATFRWNLKVCVAGTQRSSWRWALRAGHPEP